MVWPSDGHSASTPKSPFLWKEISISEGNPHLIRAVSYNVHQCIGTDGLRDPERTTQLLKELDAQIFGLQEVDSRIGRGEPQVEFLARTMKFTAIPDPAIQHPGGYYGNILLTSFPIVRSTLVDISYRNQEPRSIIDSILKVGESHVRVLVTHFGLAAAERRHQIERLLEVVCDDESSPTILLGDINEWLPFSPRVRAIGRCFGDPPAPCTFPSRFPLLALDRIWVRPRNALVSLQVYKNSLSKRTSDHLPLLAEIQIGH